MTVGIYFSVCSLVYTILLVVVFFTKPRFDLFENRIYKNLVITSLFGPIIGIPTYIFMGNMDVYPLQNIIFSKLYLIYLAMWLMIFTLYIFVISIKNVHKKKMLSFFKIATGLLIILEVSLPLYYHNADGVIYSYGPAANCLYAISSFFVFIVIYCLIKNIRYITDRKFFPIIAFLVIGTVVMIIQKLNPGLLLLSFAESFITFLMYFTIENPDVKMINELYKNKKLIEKSNEDTSRFLFRITQDIRRPVEEISDISNDMKTLNTKEEFIEASKYINNYSNQVDYLINKALNISNMDTQTIKIFENKYNPRNLFKEVSFRALENKNDNIKFSYQVSNSLPNYLYGDSIKLKQTLSSIINIAYSYTSSGFVNMDVSTIIKYGICRLVITIEDSGRGISIDRINEILSMTGSDLKSVNISNNDNCYLDIISVKKLVNMLGGSLMIKSEENKGTVVTITLDQRIVKDKSTELSKKLERYEQSLYGDKKALVIDSDEKELVLISDVLQKSGITVSSSVYAKDCIENIRSKMKYDFIILDDVLSDSSAYDVLKEISKNKNFKIPVIVMISDNKEGIKLHYMKDGFFDCIMKSKLDSELERILKRF